MIRNRISLGVLAGAAILGLNGPATTQQISQSAGRMDDLTLALGEAPVSSLGTLHPLAESSGFDWIQRAQPASAVTFSASRLAAGDRKWLAASRPSAVPSPRLARPRFGWSAVAGAPPLSRGNAGIGHYEFADRSGSSWHLGAGLNSEASQENTVSPGLAAREAYGVEAFAAFEPPGGLRIFAATVGSAAETRAAPGTLGRLGAPERKRSAKSYGKSVQLGWEIEVAGASSLMPFARVDAIDTTIAPYAEATGPIPPEYYQVKDHVRVARVGIEGIAYAAENLRLWLRGNWGHRTEGAMDANTGRLVGFYTGFADPGTGAGRDWGEAGLGLGWQIQPGMTLQASVGGASDGVRDATVSGAFGISWRQ